MLETKIKILCFVDYYLPGYKAGGPIRTIANMVENLGEEIDFYIVTRDGDFKSGQPYSGVQIDTWNIVGKAKVYYASPEALRFHGIKRLLCETPHDALYLNSFFSPIMTGLPLLIRRLKLYKDKSVILAPRGEFSPGALELKKNKKFLYIAVAKIIGLYQGIVWQASKVREQDDIRRRLGDGAKVRVAPNLLAVSKYKAAGADVGVNQNLQGMQRKSGPLRIIFLSRVSPKKNLMFLLQAICKVDASMKLTIYGPLEDTAYWKQCQALIRSRPNQVAVEYAGEITPERVPGVFSQHDLFVFPTRGENFGHVIFESLSAGTPVILSDQTPWQQDTMGAVEILPLETHAPWITVIKKWANFDERQFAERRIAALNYANKYIIDSKSLQLNRELFSAVRCYQ